MSQPSGVGGFARPHNVLQTIGVFRAPRDEERVDQLANRFLLASAIAFYDDET